MGAHGNNDPPPPPLPQRGEHPQPPPLPERSDSSHQVFKQHSNNNVTAFQNRLQPLPKSKSTPNANINPEIQELKKSVQNTHFRKQSNEFEAHNNVAKAPVFEKAIRTNKVSAMQSRIERRLFGEEKENTRQNLLARTRSSGSVLEMARNLDTQQAEQESLEEYEAQMQGKPRYNRECSDDPSSLLFTPEQLVKIAVHKAAISKQLDASEEERNVVHSNQPNNNQNMNVYHHQHQNSFCPQHQQQQIEEHEQLVVQRQLEDKQQEIQRQERLKQLQEQQERQKQLQEQQERQKQLQEQERQRLLQEKERQRLLREQQEKERHRQELEKQQIQEKERQKRLKEQQEKERQRHY